MHSRTSKGWQILLIIFCIMSGIAACGQNAGPQAGVSNNNLVGSGMTPEPGNDGKPKPATYGHWESIIANNNLVYVGSDNGSLYTLSAADGSVRGQNTFDSAVEGYSLSNGNVYAYTSQSVYATDINTGRQGWMYRSNKPIASASMLIVDNTVYISTTATGNSFTIYALRGTDGALLWSYSLNATTPGLLSVVNGMVIVSQYVQGTNPLTENMYALRASDGHVLWHVSLDGKDGRVDGAPVLLNNILYVATIGGAIYALHGDTGAQVWHAARRSGRDAVGEPVVPILVDGVIYIGDFDGIYAFQASDGKMIWQKKRLGALAPGMIQPIVSGGAIYIYDGAAMLSAVRASDGSTLWQRAGYNPSLPVIIMDGTVYVYSNGNESALHATDGSELWSHPLNGNIFQGNWASPLVVTGKIVYAGMDDGTVQAIDATNGKLLWHYTLQEQTEPTEPVYEALVTFTKATLYQQALRIVTDLGLHTSAKRCMAFWRSADNKDSYASEHILSVDSTPDGAPLWLARLKTTPEVASVENLSENYGCNDGPGDNGPLLFLQSNQSGSYLHVTFSNGISYDNALSAINALGFRLATPCYEQSRAQGKKPAWSLVGQQQAFGQSHTLTLATTDSNAVTWANQVKQTTGVTKVEAPVAAKC